MSWIGYVVIKAVGKMCAIKLFLGYPLPPKGGKSLEKPSAAGELLFAYISIGKARVKPSY